jgi:DNA polymerase-3 subunit alpha
VLEGLVLSGAMDSFGIPRSAYFAVDAKNIPYLETLVKYSNASRNSSDNAMNTLFGDASEISIPEPAVPTTLPWDPLTQLAREKEVSGIFLSGHPLDGVKMEMENFSTPGGMGMLNNLAENMGKELRLAGMIKSVNHMMSKNGKPFGRFVLEDFDSEHEFSIYGDDYVKFKNYLEPNYQIMIVGKVQSRGWKSDANQPPQLEYKISQILLLNEVLEKWGKYITIKVDAEHITPETIQQLQAYLTPSDGAAQLRVHLDYQGETTKTISGNVSRIKISEELMEKLNRLPHVAATITPA